VSATYLRETHFRIDLDQHGTLLEGLRATNQKTGPAANQVLPGCRSVKVYTHANVIGLQIDAPTVIWIVPQTMSLPVNWNANKLLWA